MERTYNYLVWGRQGGGLVWQVNGTYIFVEKPDCPGLDVGDEMPEEWGVIPANTHARDEMDKAEWGPEDQAMFDADLKILFDMLFEKVAAGEISYDQVGRFFPKEVRERNV